MEPVDLSEEQRAAILAPGSVAVRAGAGSGKTEVLARRFVALAAGDVPGNEPLSPERIAAVTFTEKATYDMKRRIAQVLDSELTLAGGERKGRLGRTRRLLPLARISTIHAFCARILRENPLEARLDPDFEVLDEERSRTLLERDVEELLMAALRRRHPGALHLVGARGLRGGTYREGALEIVLRVLGELRRRGLEPGWLRDRAVVTCREIGDQRGAIGLCVQRLKDRVGELYAARPILKPDSDAAQRIRRLEADWSRYRLESFGADSPPSDLRLLRELCEQLPAARAQAIKDTVHEVARLLRKSGKRIGVEGELLDAYGAQRALAPTARTASLIADIAEQVEHRWFSEDVVSFDDLLVRTRRLLHEQPSVARRLKQTLGALLVDEYQDTDPLQDAILSCLTEACAGMTVPQLFIVGDEKQSIYRFRGADVTVFKRAFAAAPTPRRLSSSRRALPGILEFVNALAAHLMRATSQPVQPFWVQWDEGHRLEPVRAAPPGAEPCVEVIVWPDSDGDECSTVAGRRKLEARALAARCCQLLSDRGAPVADGEGGWRAARPGDIALLLRSFEDVQLYERALYEAGVPCYTVKGRGFFGCREVLDLVELLAAVNDPDDELALAAALRSPLFALSDQCLLEIALKSGQGSLARCFRDERERFEWLATEPEEALRASAVLRELRAKRGTASLVAVVERALELTDFESVMLAQARGLQRAANIRKLVELAREFESRGLFSFTDFIHHLRRLTTEAPHEAQAQVLGENQDVARLMTFHQAKGLEFPIVIVADLGRGTPAADNNYLLSPERGLLLCDAVGSGRDELPNPLLEDYRQRLAEQDKAESARLLYVAITRARDRLLLSEGPGTKGWRGQLRAFLGEDTLGAFLASGREREILDNGPTRITLRRATAAGGNGAGPIARTPPPAHEFELFGRRARERLEFAPPAPDELLVSPSALADFDRCPRQYLLRHELEVPERDIFAPGGGSALELGTIAHTALETLDLDLRGRELDGALTRAVTVAAAGRLSGAEQAELARDLRAFIESRSRHERVLSREVPFFMKLDGGGRRLFIRGRIDLLAEDGDELVVRDYKYARREDGAPGHYQLQMECYGLAVAEALPGRRLRAELLFLRGQAEVWRVELPTPGAIRARLLAVGRAMLAARAAGDYPMKPKAPAVCRALGCGYVGRCWA